MSPFVSGAFFYYYENLFGRTKQEIIIKNSLIFLSVYIYSSRFYSPDLDHRDLRPGMAHFPIGKHLFQLIGKSPLMFLIPIQQIITKVWFYLWLPPSRLVTHRGIYHWPIIGVLTRNTYLLLIGYLMAIWISKLFHNNLDSDFLDFYKIFLNPKSDYFKIVALPVYVADFTHSAVDAWDSIKQGYSFCPQPIQRGLFAKLLKR